MKGLRRSTIQQPLLHHPFRNGTKYRVVACVLLSLLVSGCFLPEHWNMPMEVLKKGGLKGIREGRMDELLTVGSTTRQEAMSRLGEPALTLGQERYLLYRWFCVDSGMFGPIIEFDEQDIVKRYRVLYECEKELFLSKPLEIRVVLEHETDPDQKATLILSKNSVELRGPANGFEISPEQVVTGRRCGEDDGGLPNAYCIELGFSEETEAGDGIRIRMDPFVMYPFSSYIQRNCPNYVFEPPDPDALAERTTS